MEITMIDAHFTKDEHGLRLYPTRNQIGSISDEHVYGLSFTRLEEHQNLDMSIVCVGKTVSGALPVINLERGNTWIFVPPYTSDAIMDIRVIFSDGETVVENSDVVTLYFRDINVEYTEHRSRDSLWISSFTKVILVDGFYIFKNIDGVEVAKIEAASGGMSNLLWLPQISESGGFVMD